MDEGPLRVWAPDGSLGLCMTRCLGDSAALLYGVINIPGIINLWLNLKEISEFVLKENELYIITASDGIWDVIDN